MENYARHCQGCHGSNGKTVDEIPDLLNKVGYFTRHEAGRAYLIQVPNVASAKLNDAELAEMMNWMLYRFSKDQMSLEFAPFKADEVSRLRKQRISPVSKRAEIVQLLLDEQLIPDKSVLKLPHQ